MIPYVKFFKELYRIGEVPQNAWSPEDQERTKQSQPPLSHPRDHPNV
ncbi:hypothetical protein HY408_02135 [Candidatus Gottesmanbacteria bacterium]|nr:hypothetical protein [Candidatus Gottesmanbacteria bacterium]